MRCPDCNKFVAYEQQDPEVDLTVDDDRAEDQEEGSATVTASVRLVLACAECGTELKEATVEGQVVVDVKHPRGEDHTLDVEEDGTETSCHQDGKEGTPARYRRTYYGADVSFAVKCSCGVEVGTGSVSPEEQASAFDELV
jgi:hypothetical protein